MENRFLSKRYCSREEDTVIGHVTALARQADDVINLSIGDPDVNTPQQIIDAAFADAKAGYTKYTDCRGYKELRDEIAEYYKDEFDMDIADEEIMVTTSGCMAMSVVLEAILDDGDEVVSQSPILQFIRHRLNWHAANW